MAVIDSGWDSKCVDARVVDVVSFVKPSCDGGPRPADSHDYVGHGTACVRLLLGVAPAATVCALKVFEHRLETSPETIAAALKYAAGTGVAVISLSLGGKREEARSVLYDGCAIASRAGCVIVAANASVGESYPASFDNVIGVGIGPFLRDRDFASWPKREREFLACATPPPDNPGPYFGRAPSFAAPRVAGLVALLFERYPGMTLAKARDELRLRAFDMRGS